MAGELVANLISSGTVRLKSTARFFGDIEAVNLVVESGAVFVGTMKVGKALREESQNQKPQILNKIKQ